MNQINFRNNSYYHVYHKGFKESNIFSGKNDYERFLYLLDKYIESISNIYAWVLMPNHFHILLKTESVTEKPVHQYFANFLNAYARYFNIKYNRYGTLYNGKLKRIEVTNYKYFKTLVHYIHNNPVYHGYVSDMVEYPWSSYLSTISIKYSKLEREEVIGWFDSKEKFIHYHRKSQDYVDINHLIYEDFK